MSLTMLGRAFLLLCFLLCVFFAASYDAYLTCILHHLITLFYFYNIPTQLVVSSYIAVGTAKVPFET